MQSPSDPAVDAGPGREEVSRPGSLEEGIRGTAERRPSSER